MFLEFLHVKQFIRFILLYEAIRELGDNITAATVFVLTEKYVEIVISLYQNISSLSQLQSAALLYQGLHYQTVIILVISPQTVHSNLPSIKPAVRAVHHKDRAPDVGLAQSIRLRHQDNLGPNLVIHPGPLLINGLDTALRTRLTKFDYKNKTNNGPL